MSFTGLSLQKLATEQRETIKLMCPIKMKDHIEKIKITSLYYINCFIYVYIKTYRENERKCVF